MARGCPRINHLLFADDTMFFCYSTPSNCEVLSNILLEYEQASGQKINTTKSSITFSSKTPQNVKEEAMRILNISKEGGTGKYMGLPEHFGRRKRDIFTSIVDRIRLKASSWSTRRLSKAGKMTMMQSVLTAIPNHSMSCFQLPVSLCKRIQSVLTRFWWDDNDEKKKMCWVSWTELTKPKAQGGLGFRDIQLFNQALLAKIAWRLLISPNSLLSRTLLGKYCHSKSFLDAYPPASCSHGWRGILHGRPISVDAQDLRVSDLLTTDLKWNTKRITELLPNVDQEIQSLHPSEAGIEDTYVWQSLTSGVYTTSSGYQATTSYGEPYAHPRGINWWTDVWSIRASPKLKVFLWSVMQNALPTGDNLQRRNINQNVSCHRCGQHETSLHLFFQCSFSQNVWSLIPLTPAVHTAALQNIEEGILLFRKITCLPPTGITESILPWVCWVIWTARNQLIFEDRGSSAVEVATKSLALARE